MIIALGAGAAVVVLVGIGVVIGRSSHPVRSDAAARSAGLIITGSAPDGALTNLQDWSELVEAPVPQPASCLHPATETRTVRDFWRNRVQVTFFFDARTTQSVAATKLFVDAQPHVQYAIYEPITAEAAEESHSLTCSSQLQASYAEAAFQIRLDSGDPAIADQLRHALQSFSTSFEVDCRTCSGGDAGTLGS